MSITKKEFISQKNSFKKEDVDTVRKPSFCSIEVLYSCLLKCKMCYMWKNQRTPDELSIAQWKEFIVSLKNFTNLKISLNITGGEPLLKGNILDLIGFIVEQGFKDVSMTSNGFLINKDTARSIADSGLKMIVLSLDSLDKNTHDYLRGVEGAHERALDALKYFADYRGRLKKIGIQTIIMDPSLDGILELVKWANDNKISVYFMAITKPLCLPLDEDWYKRSAHNFLWPKDTVRLYAVVDELIKLKKAGLDIGNSVAQLEAFKKYFDNPHDFIKKQKQCKMGDGMIKVGSTGEVSLCSEKGPIGNIRDNRIDEIFFSGEAKNVREQIGACKTNCTQLINCFFEE